MKTGRLLQLCVLVWSCFSTLTVLGCLRSKGLLQIDIPDRVAFNIGEDIRLPCRVINDSNDSSGSVNKYNSSNIFFKMNGKQYGRGDPEIETPDDDTIVYVKKNATVEDKATLMCYGNDSVLGFSPGCYASILVGTPPTKITDFKCIAELASNMTCSWVTPQLTIPTAYTIEVLSGIDKILQSSWKKCPTLALKSCTWGPKTDPTYDRMADTFKFRVNGTNLLGTKSWEYTLAHGAFLKLSKVLKLQVGVVSSRAANLTWEQPEELGHGGWRSSLTIIYTIDIHRENAIVPEKSFEIYEKFLGLSDLIPNTRYNVSVRARTHYTKRFDLYSDPVVQEFKTEKATPDRPPALTDNSFKYALYNDVRTVTLLFDEIPKENHNAENFKYQIQVCSRRDVSCKNFTSDHSNYEISDLSVLTRYEVDVWSFNELGLSARSSHLIIGAQAELLAVPRDVAISLGDKVANMTWTTPSTLRNASIRADVFWCESHDQHTCKSRIFSDRVNNTEFYSFQVKDPRDYIFGVAMVSSDGRTSGSVWSNCETVPTAKVGRVRDFEAVLNTDTSMKLQWKTGCGYQRKYVGAYELESCVVEDSVSASAIVYSEICQHYIVTNSSNCTRMNFTVNEDDGDVFVIEDLLKNNVYRFVLRAIDKESLQFGPDSLAVCARPKFNGLAVHLIVGITVGTALGLMVLVFCLYILAKWMQKKVEVAKNTKAHLPGIFQHGVRYDHFQKRITELTAYPSNGLDPAAEEQVANMLVEANKGSHSSLDRLIIEAPPAVSSKEENELSDSGESPNLNAEPTTALMSDQAPPEACAAGPSSMPPYTQLGLSASHFTAPPEASGNTGYSQLSVVQTPPSPPPYAAVAAAAPAAAAAAAIVEPEDSSAGESSGEADDDNSQEFTQPTPPPPPPAARSNYITLDQFGKTPASSNGYVPAVRANQ